MPRKGAARNDFVSVRRVAAKQVAVGRGETGRRDAGGGSSGISLAPRDLIGRFGEKNSGATRGEQFASKWDRQVERGGKQPGAGSAVSALRRQQARILL